MSEAPEHYRRIAGITFNNDWKYDIQLGQGHIAERRLGEVFGFGTFDVTMELKTETHLWERTGNLCIEYLCDGRPSGISSTEATWWVHELGRAQQGKDFETLGYFLVPMERMKMLARQAIKDKRFRHGAGDGERFSVALVRIKDLWR